MKIMLPYLLLATCGWLACSPGRKLTVTNDPLARVLTDLQADPLAAKVLRDPAYELQIIYTQINRDANGQPHFTSFRHQVDSTRYFYPASTVKLPLALLALEKINYLQHSGYPRLTRDVPYRLDSLRPAQQTYTADQTAPGGRPSIGHDIRRIFTVSDNDAANHLFDFLGLEAINATLQEKGYTRTGIVHRLSVAGRDNRFTSPMLFYQQSSTIFKEGERFDDQPYFNPQQGLSKGRGYLRGDSVVQEPFDFSHKNWFALTDMERMLRATIFPEATPATQRFRLRDDDYPFLWHYMGIFPRECDYPRYDTTYHDNYAKFLMFGDSPAEQNGSIRLFNKIGEAYGTLTDVAYIVDFEHNVEFILAATLLCNADGIFNDGEYEYDAVGLPFLAKLGQRVYQYELKRERLVPPDLKKFREALR